MRDHLYVEVIFQVASNLCVSAEPKPVYAQPGQPDVDLPVSPSDAPIPNSTHDEGMLR